MENATTKKDKKFNMVRIMLYVSAALILVSFIMCFLPIINYTDPYSKLTTSFTGLDFTKALYSNEQTTKMYAAKALLESQKAGTMVHVVAILCPLSLAYSAIMFLLTLLATYHKKLNNIFAVGGFFAVWMVYLIVVLNVVGRMAVVNGETVLNNYAITFVVPLGAVCVLIASVINIIMVFVEDAKSNPQQKKPTHIPPAMRRY